MLACHRHICALILLMLPLAAQSWVAAPGFGVSGGRQYATAVVQGNSVYALGGTPFAANTGAAHMCSVSATTWTAVENTEGAFTSIAAEVDALNRIVIMGGNVALGDSGEVYVWDALNGGNGGLAQRSQLASGINFAHCTDNVGRIYSIGGGHGAAPTASEPNSTQVERYDAATNIWTVLAPLPSARADASACADGLGHILVFGGFDAVGVRSADVHSYDIASGAWSSTAIAAMPAARSGARAVRGSNNLIHVIGGSDGIIRNTVFVLNPATGLWTTGPAMSVARERFACAKLADGHIWAMGGTIPTGASNSCEKLFTPACPSFAAQPTTPVVRSGSSAGITVSTLGAAPMSWAWQRGGVPLSDGPTGTGSTIIGSNTDSLGVLGVGPSDIAQYTCVATNACGTATSQAASITLLPAAVLPALFNPLLLHPAGSSSSSAKGVDGNFIGGSAKYPHPTYGILDHPMRWPVTGGGGVDLTPSNSVGGGIHALHGNLAVGWWWWPYTVPGVGTGYYAHAAAWANDGTGQFWSLMMGGDDISYATDTDGTRICGYSISEEGSPTAVASGQRWPSPTNWLGPYMPPGALHSNIGAVDGNAWYGSATYSSTSTRAFALINNAFMNLHPTGVTGGSAVSGAGDGQVVGNVAGRAALWTGSANSRINLTPAGATGSEVNETQAGFQVGSVMFGTTWHAVLWAGNSNAWVDLHSSLPALYSSSYASDLAIATDGTLTICGTAYNSVALRSEAVAWKSTVVLLAQDINSISIGTGGTVQLTLQAAPQQAGHAWVLAGSLSGTTPGLALPGGKTLPLNPDPYFFFVLNNPGVLIAPSVGTFDALGYASASITLPSIPGLINAPFSAHHAFVTFNPLNPALLLPSNAALLTITP